MVALGIILLVLCLLFLVTILFRQELKDWSRDRRRRKRTVDSLLNKGGNHGK